MPVAHNISPVWEDSTYEETGEDRAWYIDSGDARNLQQSDW